jgi:hypothetical protein
MKKVSSVVYPFLTRRDIAARIDSDPAFAAECALVLHARTVERLAGRAPTGKPWGWMSSESVAAGKLVAKLQAGSILESDRARLRQLTRRYARQVAQHSVELALRAHPELTSIAAKFGVLPPGMTAVHARTTDAPTEEAAHADAESGDPDTAASTGSEDEEPDTEAFPARLLALVQGNPGQRTAEIAKALETTTAMVAPALRALVQGRKLAKRGVGRGTRYFVR